MKISTAFPRNHTTASGMVLIVVVIALAIAALLLLALFAGTRHQVMGARDDASAARAKMLTDTAVALVIGQIAQASTQTNQAWISQPGLLRTYSTNAVRVPSACYKLYSTTNVAGMIDTSGNLSFIAGEIPVDWSSTPNLYTDLNAPAVVAGGATIYPILDPAETNAASGVVGLSVDLGRAVEMPVAWLYELQDGTLGPASGGTAANPIVARIAFWTDDETCKVNVNTAGCGSPWNTPRVNSVDDAAWSSNQPAAGEYSAYPGHPATTFLGDALGTNFSPQELLALTPRYAWGGSQFGAQPTTPGETVAAKMDRLYASIDEVRYGTNFASASLRATNAIGAGQLETARFVLTADSAAPETTLLGEPRIAIWPVADTNSASAPEMTAADEAITNDATVGARRYFFERHDAQNPTNDLVLVPSNAQLFGDLVARGNETLPGYGTTLAAKYPGAEWTQLMLEIADYIRCINAVDPSPAPFVPYAAGHAGVGRGFVDPLMTTYGSGTNQVTLRGLGRCPTLSSLTIVFYVCGFGFKNGAAIDYEQTPDAGGTNWTANYLPASTNWMGLSSERIRAFAVPSTFQPGCAYPEVSDPCTIQIKGLDGLKVTNGTNSSSFGFASAMTSHPLSDALSVTPPERAWGDNEGPLAWRAAALDARQAAPFAYAFAGTNALSVLTATNAIYNSSTHALAWPAAKTTALTIATAVPLTVLIQDAQTNTIQTLSISIPAGSFPIPTPVAEYPYDGSNNVVTPSYYMTLKNRVLLTQTNREFMVQPGDVSRGIEAAKDFRVIAGLTNVPASMFAGHPSYNSSSLQHAQNLRFADGTGVFGTFTTGPGATNGLVSGASYPSATAQVTWTNWCNNTATNYAWPVSPACSCPPGPPTYVTMPGANLPGDWDTGPGFSPDGAQINLPDSGTTNSPVSAYFSLNGGGLGAPTQRTPNALVPSPVIFGSLPAGINPSTPTNSTPWRTLLFCPYPAADTAHPGFGNAAATPPVAPDHLVLDHFWMPVVEPYPISTCLATAGKINLNEQVVPFTYIHRSTALQALLKALRIPAISITSAATYKSPGTPAPTIWNRVDEGATIAQIDDRLTNGSADAYLSESEICTVPLVPQGLAAANNNVVDTQTALDSFWQGNSTPDGELTGDNLRELPYALLYGRLTTRSNSYTVHVRVQVLKKLTQDPQQNVWREGTDLVWADWRGSFEIQRYLDPGAMAPVAGSPVGPYKFRIVSSHRFAP